jgi:hypothetical protein
MSHIEPLLEKIRTGPRLAAELPRGCDVKVGGEWVHFAGFSNGLMYLESDGAGFTYRPSTGEAFVWVDPDLQQF